MAEAIPKAVKDMWDKWNIRGLVIFSLVLQAILVLLSPNRKRTPRRLFRLLIWSAYLLANWSADYAVGQISDSAGDKPEANESPKTNELLAFWAMFLLLHLGGPDTITALALEDNELWLRSLFGLLCQFIVTLYVFLLSIPNSLLVPTSLMLVAGVIKYVERIGAMRGASLERFKDSMLGEPEPGIDYTRFMEEYKNRKISKERSQLVRVKEPEKGEGARVQVRPEDMTDLQVVQYAYKYFNIYKGLVVDFIYSSQQWLESKQFFQSLSPDDALRILEVELSFIYGTLFTKVDILHTWVGAAFRCIGLGCLFASLYIFKASKKDGYDGFDVGLTYALIFGGIALDFISILIFCVSDWTFARLRTPKEDLEDKKDTRFDRFLNWLLGFRGLKWKKCICHEQEELCHMVLNRLFIFRRWSEYVYAYNLIGSSLKIKPKSIHPTRGYFGTIIRSLHIDCVVDIIIRGTKLVSKALNSIRKNIDSRMISLSITRPWAHRTVYPIWLFIRFWLGIPLINYLMEFFGISDQLNEILFTTRTRLTKELWKFIFEEVKDRSLSVVGSESASHIYSARGDWILRDMQTQDYYEKILPYVTEVEYDQSILVWHIATELLHQTEVDNAAQNDRSKEFSKTFSDYMMYLFVAQPSLMSTVAGIDKIKFKDAIAEAKNSKEAKKLFQKMHVEDSRDAKKACAAIVDSYTELEQGNGNAKGYRSKSVLSQASKLAKELLQIRTQQGNEAMWELVSRVWVEMLCYTATHCDSKQHAAQLNKGGELINFFWLLMAHFGLGEQFRTTKEDSRATLILTKTTSCLV